VANTSVVSFLANIDRDSWAHRLDPRTKVAILVFFSVIPLLFTDYRFIFMFILLVLPLWLTSKLNFRPLISPFMGVGFFMLVLFVFTAIRGSSELTNPAPEAADGDHQPYIFQRTVYRWPCGCSHDHRFVYCSNH